MKELGLAPELHPLEDHHRFDGNELIFDNDWPVVCTEKDAGKLRRLANIPSNCWYLEIAVSMPEDADAQLQALLQRHGINCG